MPTTAAKDIGAALSAHLKNMPGAWPIASSNKAFTPPVDGQYYRVSYQPNRTQTPNLDRTGYIHRGLLLVSCVVKEGTGEAIVNAEADKIASRFEYLTIINCPSGDIIISDLPDVITGFLEKPNYEVPVVIRYELTT